MPPSRPLDVNAVMGVAKCHMIESIMQHADGDDMQGFQQFDPFIAYVTNAEGKFEVVRFECYLEEMHDLYTAQPLEFVRQNASLNTGMLVMEGMGHGLTFTFAKSVVAGKRLSAHVTDILEECWDLEHAHIEHALSSGVITDWRSFLAFKE
jgi:hypothetical protein